MAKDVVIYGLIVTEFVVDKFLPFIVGRMKLETEECKATHCAEPPSASTETSLLFTTCVALGAISGIWSLCRATKGLYDHYHETQPTQVADMHVVGLDAHVYNEQ